MELVSIDLKKSTLSTVHATVIFPLYSNEAIALREAYLSGTNVILIGFPEEFAVLDYFNSSTTEDLSVVHFRLLFVSEH